MRTRTLQALVAVLLGLGMFAAAGCAKAHAKTVPDGPPLDVPAPPPRVISPIEEPIATLAPEPLEPAPAPTSTTRRPIRRPTNHTDPTQKPESVPPADVATPQAAPAEPAVVTPAPTLRAPGSAEKPVRDLITRAQRDLSRVDYAKLSEAGKTQYEQAKRFAQQAEQALKDQNVVFAQTLADKAATLAGELLSR